MKPQRGIASRGVIAPSFLSQTEPPKKLIPLSNISAIFQHMWIKWGANILISKPA